MTDYICVNLNPTPCNDDITDLLAADLAAIGYDSFETSADGLAAYIKADDFDEDAVNQVIADFIMPARIEWTFHTVKGQDWNSQWEQESFTPIVVGGRCMIHSTAHTDLPAADYDIKINPRLAFGSGHHTTTRLIIGYLLDLAPQIQGKYLIDMGTGTAILAIMAAMLGARKVVGIEIDEAAYVNALENVALNGVEAEIIHGDAAALAAIEPAADLLLANINRNIVIADLPRYAAALAPGGLMILSGFYRADIEKVTAAAEAQGLRLLETRHEPTADSVAASSSSSADDWVALLLQKQ